MIDNRERAKMLMQHYFDLIAYKAGVDLNVEHRRDIDELIDCIIDAAKEELKSESD